MLYRKLLRWIIIYAECRLPPVTRAGAGVARLGCQLSGRAACCPLLSARLLPTSTPQCQLTQASSVTIVTSVTILRNRSNSHVALQQLQHHHQPRAKSAR